MKSVFPVITAITFAISPLTAQNIPVNERIDKMLIHGDYENVIDTCRQILAYDSLNPEIHYRMGIAYQNTLEDDLSLSSFCRAASLNPDNKIYNFMLAKGYYGKEKYTLAEPLLIKLCSLDSMKWIYTYYLTSIYMHNNKYDEAINIYKRFLTNDSTNYNYLDKIAFASLRKGDYDYAKDLYNKSLLINPKNLIAIKNLAYLHSVAKENNTAVQLLTRGIETDPSDIDLFVRRASLYYSMNYNKRALNDYLVILASGDSSEIYLKRAGIGYCNNLQPGVAIRYLLKAYAIDSSDYETCSYLGQSYHNLKDMKNSVYYYKRVISILTPINRQLGLSYVLLATSQKSNRTYRDAIASYRKAQDINADPNIYMIIANIYDENLNDSKNAIYYYQTFLNNLKKAKYPFAPEYIESVKKRMEFLKENPAK